MPEQANGMQATGFLLEYMRCWLTRGSLTEVDIVCTRALINTLQRQANRPLLKILADCNTDSEVHAYSPDAARSCCGMNLSRKFCQ